MLFASEVPTPVHLKDYKPSHYMVSDVHLTFDLEDEKTKVTSKLHFYINPKSTGKTDLFLNGEEMELLSLKLDDEKLDEKRFNVTDKGVTLFDLPDQEFTLEIENIINPKANTALDGLYKSGKMFCSQNEPQGFRRITYFLDRPDVMAKYTTKVIGDKELYPILLSNGNPIAKGDLENGKHWIEWEDPFPKPCYLFALVAGDLGKITDTYKTKSGKTVDLVIYCDHGNEERCLHAMDSLKKSMKWDEDVFGLEYDLDIFMIVAVDAFNMGAMENKGLNIFNSSCVLAHPKTETDANFARVEGVVAHEYFHNWTGNRVTCRDWFQLTLKEGLTVFRDQEFSSDMNSRPVIRTEEVGILRNSQFPEDAGPTAHPIKPKTYLQINNFYTSTVYCKGAEIIRMIQSFVGKENFRKGIDKYFELFDGQAVTTEDFVHAMQLASGFDFSQFTRWYHQAGTPKVSLQFNYDESAKMFTLKVAQKTAPTADGSAKEAFQFPLMVALFDESGKEVNLGNNYPKNEYGYLLDVTKENQEFKFESASKPVMSVNRNFMAPVEIDAPYSDSDFAFLVSHDTDPFNRYEAMQEFASRMMLDFVASKEDQPRFSENRLFFNAYETLLKDTKLEKSIKSMSLTLPAEGRLGQKQDEIQFERNHLARETLAKEIANKFKSEFEKLFYENVVEGEYRFHPDDVGKRALKNCALKYLCITEDPKFIDVAYQQFKFATNMTEKFAALCILNQVDCEQRELALAEFRDEWKDDKLVMMKWLQMFATSKLDDRIGEIEKISDDEAFDKTLPNHLRVLYGLFTENHTHFHALSGKGYKFIADRVIEIDQKNPQIASRISNGFRKFSKLDPKRKALLKAELERIIKSPGLSSNVREMVQKCLDS